MFLRSLAPPVLLASSILLTLVSSLAIKRSTSGPLINDFPDPALLKVGGTWYGFATQNEDGSIHVQVASSGDFNDWSKAEGKDALPSLPAWVDATHPNIWAPHVVQRDDGSFVLYYSAALASNPDIHCVGAATSNSIEGPYTSLPEPFACPVGQGGAIDAAGFRDTNGKRYVVYKVDGNALGHGGVCNNGIAPIVPTPIMLQEVQEDGITHIGSPMEILDRDDRDGPLVEAPSLVRGQDGTYYLFFSSNCYSTPNYDVTWATASSVTGPYTKFGPLFVTGTNGLTAPGGATADADGRHMVFHANSGNGRAMFTAEIHSNENMVTV